jgi:hypothetical protein
MLKLEQPLLKLLAARSMGAQTSTLVQLLSGDFPDLKAHQARTALCALHQQGKITRDRRYGANWRVAA